MAENLQGLIKEGINQLIADMVNKGALKSEGILNTLLQEYSNLVQMVYTSLGINFYTDNWSKYTKGLIFSLVVLGPLVALLLQLVSIMSFY